MSNTLHLNLRKKWFDMIISGKKKEEYREIKEYWENRFSPTYTDYGFEYPKSTKFKELYIRMDIGSALYDTITFRNGYSANAPQMVIECLGITTGKAIAEWSDNWEGDVFILKLGDILNTSNIDI